MATLELIGSGHIGGTLAGKTVIDTGNYFAPRDGTIPELEAQQDSARR